MPGRALGRLLNHGNRELIAAAVEEMSVHPGAVVAELGFGGGRGLELLLARVGPRGRLHGVEISAAMLASAQRKHHRAVSSGRLVLHEVDLQDLPLPEDSLDGAMTLNTIYFVRDLGAALTLQDHRHVGSGDNSSHLVVFTAG